MTSAPEDVLEFAIRRESDSTLAAMTVASSARYLQAFPRDERGVIGTVVSELATNIIKYAGQGVIRIEPLLQDGKPGVRVRAIDHGPGIADLDTALRDGFSTGGTLGLGLPAVRRMMDSLHIHCPEGGGTQVEAIRWCRRPVVASGSEGVLATGPTPRKAALTLQLRIETRQRAYRFQAACGDCTWSHQTDRYALLVQLDGTGHGPTAHDATVRIVRSIEAHIARWPVQPDAGLLPGLLDACHAAATTTVGAAITLALIDRTSATLHQVGVGNTCIMAFSPSGWEGVPRAGVIGQRYRPPVTSSHRLSAGDTVVLFSDGLSSSQIRQLRRRSDRPTNPVAIADLLMSTAKPEDDASCLVVTCS